MYLPAPGGSFSTETRGRSEHSERARITVVVIVKHNSRSNRHTSIDDAIDPRVPARARLFGNTREQVYLSFFAQDARLSLRNGRLRSIDGEQPVRYKARCRIRFATKRVAFASALWSLVESKPAIEIPKDNRIRARRLAISRIKNDRNVVTVGSF